jgi:general secretion pathway protein F
VQTVRAGERTGDVARSLARFVAYQSQMDALKRKIFTASLYPTLVLLVGLLVVGFLAVYVIPKFSHIYADIGRSMPLSARLLVVFGQFVEHHGRLLALAFAVTILGTVILLRQTKVREWLTDQLWRIPRLGERLRLYQLARFYRTMGMLVTGGTPFVSALDQASGLLPSTLRARLDSAKQSIQQGRALSFALEQNGLTTPVADSLLQVAERSGAGGEMLERIAQFYDEDLSRWIDRFARLFEPLLMLAIGIIVGIVVVLMYQPIFELASGIQ